MPANGGKTRVAVLGGGPAGVAAAFELTATPALRERYEVTIHQLGWRLGGKCASGRNRERGDRIEEHGLHIWFGFYDNAFRLMQRCYAELGRPPGAQLAGWQDAFKPSDDLVLFDEWDGRWTSRSFRLPRNGLSPGTDRDPSFWDMAQLGLAWLAGEWDRLLGERPGLVPGASLLGFEPAFVRELAGELGVELDRLGEAGATSLLGMAQLLAELSNVDPLQAGPPHHAAALWRVLGTFKSWLWEQVVAPQLDDDELRFFFMALDFWAASVRGIVEDGLAERGFAAINGEDFREWLARHGAAAITLDNAPFVRGYYDLAFAYEEGDKSRPNMAAGAGLQALVRMLFSYKGAFLWKMQAGMGDTVFAPLYEVLRRRGVRFEFFHSVTRLGLSPDRRSVAEVELVPQVAVPGGEYRPLFEVDGLPCWPSEPDWEQLEHGDDLRRRGVDLEREPDPLGAAPITLRQGADFDSVVLGIPVGALPGICAELAGDAGNPRFAEMLARARTVMTQAAQLWVGREFDKLGWPYGQDSIAGSYAAPLDTFCDMTHLARLEDWPGGGKEAAVAYFCGVLKHEPGGTPSDALARVEEGTRDYIEQRVGGLWPFAGAGDGRGFDWRLLVDPENRQGAERLEAQYLRANFEGTERYALTPAGSVEHRLWPDESGYDNLYLAGDWTRSNIDGGSVEGAVTSGLLAARALSGSSERIRGIAGWLSAERSERQAPAQAQRPLRSPLNGAGPLRAAPRYVEYGGLTNVPGPLLCRDTTLHGFWVEADHDRLAALCEKVFARPSGGAVQYHPLGRHLMITFGVINRIVAQTPPFDAMGEVTEPQVAIWMPVAAVRRVGAALVAERFAMFVPYIWLDNPISLASGREVFGWAKNFGWPGLPDPAGPEQFTLDTFGMNYGRGEQPGRRRLITIERGPAHAEALPERREGLQELASDIGDILFDREDDAFVIPSLGLVAGIAGGLARGELREVFLKQFRSVGNGLEAVAQQIVETPMRITRLRAEPLVHEYAVTVEPLDSHPLIGELGLASQSTRLAYRVEMDFVVETGSVLWEAGAPGRALGDGHDAWLELLGLPVRTLGRIARRLGV